MLLELPAYVGWVDYRLLIGPPAPLGYDTSSPQTNPTYVLDEELIYIRKPHTHIQVETVGDLVHWLRLPDENRYVADVRYDARGFRNEVAPERAEVVAIGDSMLEAALVPYEDLLTTRLSEHLGTPVANLGQTGYGPYQELAVLRRYALPLQPRAVVWLFFEGNDLRDVVRYERFRQDWERMQVDQDLFRRRAFTVNLRAALAWWLGGRSRLEGSARERSCRVEARDGPADLWFAYAGKPLDAEAEAALQRAESLLGEAHASAAAADAALTLAFVPTKFRVYRERCTFPPGGLGHRWQPNDLPDRLGAWADGAGVRWLDLTGPLRAAADRGELVYFPDDGHLNAAGHAVIAETLAEVLAGCCPDAP